MIDWICRVWLRLWVWLVVCCSYAMKPALKRLSKDITFKQQLEYAINSTRVKLARSPHIPGHPMLGKVKVVVKERTVENKGRK